MISEPTLVLRKDICRANINRMAEKAREHNLAFKPHMKTHQSKEIGQWLKEAGAEAITVSSIKMARYFAESGWRNITIALPAHPGQCKAINDLASNVNLSLLVNKKATVQALKKSLVHPLKVYIEIDTGSNRTGLNVNQLSDIKNLISDIEKIQKLKWIGFYSHPGHSYQSDSKTEIQNVQLSVIKQCQTLTAEFKPSNGEFEVCIGDTPCCSIADTFNGIDAISPGNFVFYDLMQYQIGSCHLADIAIAVKCPVIDVYPNRDEIAIHGGAVHFSKEKLQHKGITHFGMVAANNDDQWHIKNPQTYLKALSQEHGLVKCAPGTIGEYKVGNTITVLPIHSCLTANLMRRYTLANGETIEQMPV